MNRTLALTFNDPMSKGVPGQPMAQVNALWLSDGQFLTPRAASFQELKGYLDSIRNDLAQIEKEAEAKFAVALEP